MVNGLGRASHFVYLKRSMTGTFITLIAATFLTTTTGLCNPLVAPNADYQINGIIYYPNGRHVGGGIMVGLSNSHGLHLKSTTDESGTFKFNVGGLGSYHITVNAGNDFETVDESIDYSGSTHSTLVINLKSKEKPREAIGTIDAKAYINIPREAQKLFEDAMKLSEAGHVDKSADKLRRAIEICPTYGFAYNELAVDYLRLDRVDDAIVTIKSALRLMPNHYAPHLNYGIALVRKEDYQGAIRELRFAVDKERSSSLAHMYMGRALIGLGKYDEAEGELRTALRLENGRMVEAHRFLGFVYIRRKDKPQAISELETYLKLVPQANDAPKIKQLIAQLR
jgi:tetratricopeptide (TPR) repeat protein